MAEGSELGQSPDWVTVAEAARRLRMSPSWLKAWAKQDGIEIIRRGNQPGVYWPSVEAATERSRVIGRFRRQADPDADLPASG